nr:leucine-rich repeat domain-containing protein [uncultured Porphyromonas sp.]
MNYKKLIALCSMAILVGSTILACSKTEPKPKKEENTNGHSGATKKPNNPANPTDPNPKEVLPALREGEVRVAVPQAGGLEAALKGKDLSTIRILLLTSGAINQDDCDFIRYSLQKLEEVDLSRVALGITDDEYGLKDNKSLKKIIAPATLRRIPTGWFSYTRAEEIVFPGDKLRVFGGALFNERVKKITLPESVEEILPEAFWNNKKMETINLPSKIKVIPARCFYFCQSLRTIEIPAGVTELQVQAFDQCAQLERITFLGEAPALQRGSKGQLLDPFGSVVWEQAGVRKCVIRVGKGKTKSFLEKWQWSADKASRFEEQ